MKQISIKKEKKKKNEFIQQRMCNIFSPWNGSDSHANYLSRMTSCMTRDWIIGVGMQLP